MSKVPLVLLKNVLRKETISFLEEHAMDSRKSMGSFYRTFRIPKKSGKLRVITAPSTELKAVQKDIMYNILYKARCSKHAVGFIRGKSLKDGATPHLGADCIVTVDINNFFPSIDYKKVKIFLTKLLISQHRSSIQDEDLLKSLSIRCAGILAKVLTLKGGLPQGSPASPAISNMIMRNFDNSILNLIQEKLSPINPKLTLTYTRYADDLTVSIKEPYRGVFDVPDTIITVIKHELMVKLNLYLNPKKSRIQRKHKQMSVTGVVVNERTNVPRKTRLKLRAEIHNIVRSGKVLSRKEIENLKGRIAWVYSLNKQQGQKLFNQVKHVRTV